MYHISPEDLTAATVDELRAAIAELRTSIRSLTERAARSGYPSEIRLNLKAAQRDGQQLALIFEELRKRSDQGINV